MAYLALYRKFRPQNFDEVIGQEHIVKTLTNQIKNGNISHAYLFCGTRGTGKTSCARSFAKAVNCLNPQNGSACGKCEVCLAYENSNGLDIVEIDAASNNRVDEIRDLREKVGFSPTVGKYKVYIIDEVHMLTESAFNALLKTLEEPPSHAIFILCTTEVHKLPATILSRCTKFDFRLVNNEDLEKHLQKVFDACEIKYDKESLQLIAKAGAGSVRDTLSTAEMCASFCDRDITYDKVLNCLGITNNQTLFKIVEAVGTKNTQELLKILNVLNVEGKNIVAIVKDLIDYVNKILIYKLTKDENSINLPTEDKDNVKKLAEQLEGDFLLKCLNNIAEIETSLKTCLNPNMLVEIALLKCILEQTEIEKLNKRIDELEKKTKNADFVTVSNVASAEKVVENVSSFKENNTLNAKQIFGELVNYIKNEKMFLLYATCGDVKKVDIVNGEFIIYCSQESLTIFKQNFDEINRYIKNKYNGISLKLEELSTIKSENNNVDEELKEKLGNKLTIKE